jgi:hypothetical protein
MSLNMSADEIDRAIEIVIDSAKFQRTRDE